MIRWGRSLATGLSVLAALLLLAATAGSAAAATERTVVPRAALPAGSRVLGALPASSQVHLTVVFRTRDAAGLSALAAAVSQPGSAQFRHYLTVRQFAARFGATDASIAATDAALRADGLTIGAVGANRLTQDITGTTGEVERALSVSLARVTLRDGRTVFANTTAARLPARLAGAVANVLGLASFARAEPAGRLHLGARSSRPAVHRDVLTGGPQPCAAASDAAGQDDAYTADDLASAYDMSPLYGAGDLGTGETIGLFELEANFPSDISAFESCYGIDTSVNYQAVDGGAGIPNVQNGDGIETELDVETAIELAPGARVTVFQGPSNASDGEYFDTLSAMVTADEKIISISYTTCEFALLAAQDPDGPTLVRDEGTLFQEAAAQGESVFAASGDAGSAACADDEPPQDINSGNDFLDVNDPASQPYVISVGGTALYTPTSSGPVAWTPGADEALDEGVWNDGTDPNYGPGASTGGISQLQAMPGYQASAPHSLGVDNAYTSGVPCGVQSVDGGACREVPDVSASADPYFGYLLYYDGTWTSVGGTSGASPLWAGLTALTDASAACHGLSVGFENPALYALAGSAAYGTDFRDITTANPLTGAPNNDPLFNVTGADAPDGLYPVTAGYDLATGLGSPIGANLAAGLCRVRTTYPVTVDDPGAQRGTRGVPASLALHATDPGSSALVFRATGLPSGLSISSAGVVSGTPKATGSSRVTITATDPYGNVGQTQFTWSIGAPPAPTARAYRLTGAGTGAPKLSLTVDAAPNAPALRSLTLALPPGLQFGASARDISLTSGSRKVGFTARISHGELTLRLAASASGVTVTVAHPAITVSGVEASAIRARRVTKLSLHVTSVDAGGNTAHLVLSLTQLT